MSESIKIRVAGTKEQVELMTEKLREFSKQWGNKKIFRVRRYDRQKATGHINKFHLTFGNRRFVNYISMKLPKNPKHPVCMMEGHSGDEYCGRCGIKMQRIPSKKIKEGLI